jgi:sortase (surface protein transpeptidase)
MPRKSKKTKVFSVEKRRGGQWLVVRIRLPSVSIDHVFSGGLVVAGLIGMTSVLLPAFFPSAPEPSGTVAAVQPVAKQPASLPRSIPTHLEIPDIQLSTELSQVGKNADDTLEVPADATIAAWYKFSPTPGEIGPAIITGHVDTYLGPAVFFYLKDLQPGQKIFVTRQDKSTVTFQVDKVAVFDQQAFPTKEVYGNIDYPGLRLITCGGTYNVLSGHYSHNTVVYASMLQA